MGGQQGEAKAIGRYIQIAEINKVGIIMMRSGKLGEEILSSFLICEVLGGGRTLKRYPGI